MILLEYKLNPNEIEESLLCLSLGKKDRKRNINIAVWVVFSVGMLLAYFKMPNKIELFYFALFSIFMLFYVTYKDIISRKYLSYKLSSVDNIFRLKIYGSQICGGDNIQYKFGEHKGELFLSKTVMTLNIGKNWFCIPLRVFTNKQYSECMEILSSQFTVVNVELR